MTTIKDVAEKAGVSRATAGFVLSDQPGTRISTATRLRVLEIAKQLQYRPNHSARSIRRGKFGVLSLLLSNVNSRSLLPMPLLSGICDALAARDMHLIVTKLPDEKLTSSRFVPKILRESASDGLLINYNAEVPEALAHMIGEHQLPAIWINVKKNADCVYPDDWAAGQRAAEHLMGLGHTKLAYVDYSRSPHYSTQERRDGFLQTVATAGNKGVFIGATNGALSYEERIAACRVWLASPDRPTAVFLYTSHMIAPLMVAAQDMGLHVPDDLSVITTDVYPAFHFGLYFTTLILPEYEMGEQAVEMVLLKIDTPPSRCPFAPIRSFGSRDKPPARRAFDCFVIVITGGAFFLPPTVKTESS